MENNSYLRNTRLDMMISSMIKTMSTKLSFLAGSTDYEIENDREDPPLGIKYIKFDDYKEFESIKYMGSCLTGWKSDESLDTILDAMKERFNKPAGFVHLFGPKSNLIDIVPWVENSGKGGFLHVVWCYSSNDIRSARFEFEFSVYDGKVILVDFKSNVELAYKKKPAFSNLF